MVITLHLRSGNKISLEVPEETAKEIEGGVKFKQMN